MTDYVPDLDHPFLEGLLERLFGFLATVLPQPLFDLAVPLVTHVVSFGAALAAFVSALTGVEWDAQKILPPLITLLAAYLALVSFYRTTGWMIRTAFAFVKWGGIIAALAAGAGYFMANAGQGQGNGVGILPMVGNAVFSMLSGQGGAQQGDARRTRQARTRERRQGEKQKARGREKAKERPKAWENWDKHRDWQTGEDAARRSGEQVNEAVQETMDKVMGFVREGMSTGWWEAVKGVVEGGGGDEATEGANGRETRSQRRAREGTRGRG